MLGTALVAALLHRFTDSTTELADAATTVVSLVAQVMMNRRWIQSWFVWIAVDIGFIGLLASKGLFITAALYAVFIGLCMLGYHSWRRALATDSGPAPMPTAATAR